MTTAKFLSIVLCVLALLSTVAYFWKPAEGPSGKTPLVWVSDNNPARAEQISTFNQEHPDLFLSLDYGSNGVQKIILQCSSGVGPDIFDYSNDQLETLVSAGVVEDVTEAAKEMSFSAGKDLWPSGSETVDLDGRQYGFPCNIGSQILIYNKNVFDYFGIPYPQGTLTWDEFLELAKKVNSATNADPGKKQIFAISGLNWQIFFDTLHGEFFTEDGLLNIVDNKELRQAFQMHKDYLFTYRLMPSSVELKAMSGQGGWGAGNLNQFAFNRFAMVITGHWSLIAFTNAYQQQLAGLQREGIKLEEIKDPLALPLRIGSVLIPKFADRPASYRVQARLAGINSKSPRRKEALAFLQYLAGPTYSKLLNEGADWLPGNPKYAMLGVDPGVPALDREGMQKSTAEAMTYGYIPRRSPFLLTSDVMRVLGEQASRLESDPSIEVDDMLRAADKNLQTLMRRNLDRDPTLQEKYVARFGKTAN